MRSFRSLLLGFTLSILSLPALAVDLSAHALRWMAAVEPAPTAAVLSAEYGLRPDAGPVLAVYDLTLNRSAKTPSDAIVERLSGFTATSYDTLDMPYVDFAANRSEVRPATIAGRNIYAAILAA